MCVVFAVEIRLCLYLTDSMVESLDNSTVTLKDVLIFITGADRVPPLGLSSQPMLTFLMTCSPLHPPAP